MLEEIPTMVPIGTKKYFFEEGEKEFPGNIADHARRIYNCEQDIEQGTWSVLYRGRRIPCEAPTEELDMVLEYLKSFGSKKIIYQMLWRPGHGDFLYCKAVE